MAWWYRSTRRARRRNASGCCQTRGPLWSSARTPTRRRRSARFGTGCRTRGSSSSTATGWRAPARRPRRRARVGRCDRRADELDRRDRGGAARGSLHVRVHVGYHRPTQGLRPHPRPISRSSATARTCRSFAGTSSTCTCLWPMSSPAIVERRRSRWGRPWPTSGVTLRDGRRAGARCDRPTSRRYRGSSRSSTPGHARQPRPSRTAARQAVAVGVGSAPSRRRTSRCPTDLRRLRGRRRPAFGPYGRLRRRAAGGNDRRGADRAGHPRVLLRGWVPPVEGYGMTEPAPWPPSRPPEHHRSAPSVSGAPDRYAGGRRRGAAHPGRQLFAGYHGNEAATDDMLVDGWLLTGDVGEIDADGYVKITGRKKEIIITAGGKNLSPANLENDLKKSRWISQAVMHGDRGPSGALITSTPTRSPPSLASTACRPTWSRRGRAHGPRLDPGRARRGQLPLRIYRADQALPPPRSRPHPGSRRADPDAQAQAHVVNDRYAAVFDALYE